MTGPTRPPLPPFDEASARRREASINDVAIAADERRITGPRPEAERGQEIPLR